MLWVLSPECSWNTTVASLILKKRDTQVIKVGDLVSIPYLYASGDHGVGVVLATDEGKTCSKKIFILWSTPDDIQPPRLVKEWVDESILEVISKKKDKESTKEVIH